MQPSRYRMQKRHWSMTELMQVERGLKPPTLAHLKLEELTDDEKK